MDVVTYALCKSLVSNAIAQIGDVFTIKGKVLSYQNLPVDGNEQGDIYLVGPNQDGSYDEYYWTLDGTWDSLGSTGPDMSSYIDDKTLYAGEDGTGTVKNPAKDTILYVIYQLEESMYSAQPDATEVQLAIDGDNVISAKIVDGSITSTKLAEELQQIIDNASQAIANLKSAAYAETSDFDIAGAAQQAEDNAKKYTDDALTWTNI